jgi:hypothetical protein
MHPRHAAATPSRCLAAQSRVARLAILFLPAILFLAACRRDKCCNVQPGITGSWQLIRVEGGIAGITIVVPADSPVVLTLNNDKTYSIQNRLMPAGSGTYFLTDTPVYSNTPQPAIVFDKMEPISYNLASDTLYLGADFDDNFVKIYRKIN